MRALRVVFVILAGWGWAPCSPMARAVVRPDADTMAERPLAADTPSTTVAGHTFIARPDGR